MSCFGKNFFVFFPMLLLFLQDLISRQIAFQVGAYVRKRLSRGVPRACQVAPQALVRGGGPPSVRAAQALTRGAEEAQGGMMSKYGHRWTAPLFGIRRENRTIAWQIPKDYESSIQSHISSRKLAFIYLVTGSMLTRIIGILGND